MIVTFSSKASSDITLFGNIAQDLLRMMGHSGTIPSALLAGDVPATLARLEHAIDAATPPEAATRDAGYDADDGDATTAVGLRQRAWPLIEMLTAAARDRCDVMWKQG